VDVAVAGSSGLIGRALARELESAGHRVRPLLRPSSPPHPDGIRWDPAGGWIDEDSLRGAGAIVNLAGEPIGARRWTVRHKALIRQSRIDATSVLARAIAAMPDPKPAFVSSSASGYYGERGEEILEEASEPGEGFLARVCVAWEAATRPAADAGARVAISRSGIVLDPGGGLLQRLVPLFKLGLGGRLGSGRQWTPWISLRDEARALAFLIANDDVSGPFNLCTAEPVRNQELTRSIGRAVRRPTPFVVPAFALRAAFGEDAVRDAFLTSARLMPAALLKAGFSFEDPALGAALASML